MGWHNPPMPWSELERRLSGRPPLPSPHAPNSQTPTPTPRTTPAAPHASTEDHHRADSTPALEHIPYAELHAHSHYSFLDGASSPEALIARARELQLAGIALTDHDGFAGAARFAEAATATATATATEHHPLLTIYGSELTIGLDEPQLGTADPAGSHLLILAQGVSGYHRLAAAITEAGLAGERKGRPAYDLEALAAAAHGEWVVLTGCRKGALRQALDRAPNRSDGERAATAVLEQLTALFGRDRVYVELTDHGYPEDSTRNDRLAALAQQAKLPTLVTGNVHYATAAEATLAEAMAAIRANRSLDELAPYLPATAGARLRSGAELLNRFMPHRDAIERTVPLAQQLAFQLRAARPGLPHFEVPDGHTPMSWLRHLAHEGARARYPTLTNEMSERIDRELSVIEHKNFAGYFLIMHDIVRFARQNGILCQGRGSAANSAVCYVLGITAVDSIFYDLPFERFLNSLREEEPDIDVDFESNRREEVIQYVYRKYGRKNAAQVANVITYRPRSAIRDAAKALGYSAEEQRTLASRTERSRQLSPDVPEDVHALANRLLNAPRHLGIHSGGMVLTDRPVGEICPIEHARMPGRTVLQWDKDDCASMGLVKFDLLGLGMLNALRVMIDLVAEHTGERWSLETLPKEEAGVYDMLCRADAIGVFQLESRAQLNTLPRLLPRSFYDLVIEIALIRPGPLQGGAIHPYLRRRRGIDPPHPPHPALQPVLERTLGVPLFQEQLMQIAMVAGGCDAADADLLRRAMGSKRGVERIEQLRDKLLAGMAANGIAPDQAELIYTQIESFAGFGFAESHSISFALLVYASAWFKLHYPATFLAGLLQSQPMGFYAPRTLVEDARRHGVTVLAADVQHPTIVADLEPLPDAPFNHSRPPHGLSTQTPPTHTAHPKAHRSPAPDCFNPIQPPVPPFDRHSPDTSALHRKDTNMAVRLGLSDIRGMTRATAERIVHARRNGPFADLPDLARRADLERSHLEALSAAGACESFGLNRRESLWAAAPAETNRQRYLPGIAVHVQPPLLPLLSDAESTALDLWMTGVVAGTHPIALLRRTLDQRGVVRSDLLRNRHPRTIVTVAGLVTHRQRPSTAGGITFVTLEDEAGSTNLVVWAEVWNRHRSVAGGSAALLVTGMLERSPEGVINIIAIDFEALAAPSAVTSRDFR